MYMYISTGWPIVSMNSTVRKSTFHIPGMKSQMNLTIFRCYYHIWNSGMKIQPNRWFYMNELCSFCLYHYNNFAYEFGIFIFSNMLYHLVSIRFEWFFLPSRVSQWRMVRSSLVAVPCWLRCFWECWVSPLMWPWCCWRLVPHNRREQNIQESIKNLMGPNPNGPCSVSCDRAIRYSGFFRGPFSGSCWRFLGRVGFQHFGDAT